MQYNVKKRKNVLKTIPKIKKYSIVILSLFIFSCASFFVFFLFHSLRRMCTPGKRVMNICYEHNQSVNKTSSTFTCFYTWSLYGEPTNKNCIILECKTKRKTSPFGRIDHMIWPNPVLLSGQIFNQIFHTWRIL